MKRSGFSILELVIALAISGMTFFALSQSSSTMMSTLSFYSEIQVLQRDLPVVRKSVSNYVSNALVMATASVDAPRTGMLIDGHGGIILGSDLRRCSELDPSTSMDPANITEVQIVCCEQTTSVTIALPDPPFGAGASRTLSSTCQTPEGGLSIQLLNQGNVINSVCYKEFDEFYLSEVGTNLLKNQPMLMFDLVATFSKSRSEQVLQTQRLQLFESIRGTNTFMVDCL